MGGGVYAKSSTVVFAKSHFSENVAAAGGGRVYWLTIEPLGLLSKPNMTETLTTTLTIQQPHEFNNSYANNRAMYGPDVASEVHVLESIYEPTSPEESGRAFVRPLTVHLVKSGAGNEIEVLI